jgi:hypothetical protein
MSEISRRTTIAWMLAASASVPLGGYRMTANAFPASAPAGAAAGYGTDPNLLKPVAPWPLTLSPAQREAVRIAADLIIPADERSPSAGSLHLDAFVDEWVSAPYPRQQGDAKIILSGLAWLDAEANRRFGKPFAQSADDQRRAIFDDIAWKGRVKPGMEEAAVFFGKLRQLVIAGFYTRPEGAADLGYKGNTPILGDYPGPSAEALAHLHAQLAKLNLPEPA